MIKGINRHMIEVVDTDSIYYERAFLLLRPRYRNVDSETLEKEAIGIIRSMDVPSSVKSNNEFKYRMIRFLSALILGSAITLIIQHFI